MASLGLLMALGLMGGLARQARPPSGRAELAEQFDAVLKSDGQRGVEAKADSPPLVRMAAAVLNPRVAAAKAYQAESAASGLDLLISDQPLTPDAPALRNCPRIAALEGRAQGIAGSLENDLASAKMIGDSAVAAGQARQAEVDGFIKGAAGRLPEIRRSWDLTAAVARDGAALCRLLAKGGWQAGESGAFTFVSTADAAEFNRLASAINAASAQALAIRESAVEGSKKAMEKLR